MSKEAWEVDDVDLNFRHYSGHHTSVTRRVKHDIEKYLINPDVPEEKRIIYSAIYHSLNYYQDISYSVSSEFSTDDSFLSYTLCMLNEDYEYLSSKYNTQTDPTQPPVITLQGRIKSPISFIQKVKEKVNEYLDEGRDFKYFTESLRDLIGARIVVTPPKEIQEKGLEAENEFLYKVFYDFMDYRKINEQVQNINDLKTGQLYFLDVNTRHDPNKMQRLKERPAKKGFDEALHIGTDSQTIYIPKQRIPEIEQPHVDSKVKDYIAYPKFSGYQSIHVCVIPDYSNYTERAGIPSYIIPPDSQSYSFEYQFRTAKQNEFAEHGTASHKSSYKKDQENYHRLAIPLYFDFDKDEDLEECSEAQKKFRKIYPSKSLKLRNFAECLKRFYGFSFLNRFRIPFKKFRDSFDFSTRNAILASRKLANYDESTNTYLAIDLPISISATKEDFKLYKKIKNSYESNSNKSTNYNEDYIKLLELLDKYNISDCCINANDPFNNEQQRTVNLLAHCVFTDEKSLLTEDNSKKKSKDKPKEKENSPLSLDD